MRECRQNEETICANAHANSLMKKDMTSFWKGIKKDNITRVPFAPMADDCIGDKEIVIGGKPITNNCLIV